MVHRCSVCGYIYQDDEAPHECPICHNPQSVFEVISEKKLNYEFFKDTWARQVKWMNATKYQDEIMLNPKEETLKMLAEAEAKSLLDKKKGQAYCPCRILTRNKSADRKIICPCIFYPGEVEQMGRCHCSLYVKIGFIPGLENPNG